MRLKATKLASGKILDGTLELRHIAKCQLRISLESVSKKKKFVYLKLFLVEPGTNEELFDAGVYPLALGENIFIESIDGFLPIDVEIT